jgi:hypothetical protein
MKSKKPQIVWPTWDRSGAKIRKHGTIDGISMKKIWTKCQRDANKYVNEKFPHLLEEDD